MVQLQSLVERFEHLWPLSGAEEWDAPGLVTGSFQSEVRKVMLTLDVTSEVVDFAVQAGADLLLAHHPYIMRGVKTISEQTAKGNVLAKAIRENLAIYAAHTNADIVEDGVSDILANALGLVNAVPLSDPAASVGHGRIGSLSEAMSLGEFATRVARVLPMTATGVRVAGDYNQVIERVAVCGGAGDSFLPIASAAGADVYLTADLRHHVVQDAREQALISGGPAVIDVSHWASEFLWVESAAEQLRRIYPDLVFEVCDLRTDPWDFVVTQ
ncbi:MAG: hypothetical protein RJA35_873 [Actinomycetota bacterium]|jgi:dinuclear metal center YbgI/SA1388 family protein